MPPFDPFADLGNDLPDPISGTPAPKSQSRLQAFPFDDEDRDLAIRTIWGEAAGGGPQELEAVARTIRARAAESGQRPKDVVLAKGQFEPWMREDRRQAMLGLDPNSDDYRNIASIVDPLFTSDAPIEGEPTHFYAPRAQAALGRKPPKWAQGQQPQIAGRQAFYDLPYGDKNVGAIDVEGPKFGAMGEGAQFETLGSDLPEVDPFEAIGSDLPDPTQPGAPEPFLGGAFVRGQARLGAGATLLTQAIGSEAGLSEWSPDVLAKTIWEYKQSELAAPPSQAVKEGQEAFAAAPTDATEMAKVLLQNPSFTLSSIAESLPTFEASLLGMIAGAGTGAAAGAVGGPVGSVGGGLGGAAVGSGLGDASLEMLGYIEKKTNPQSQEDWARALSDPFLVNEALWYGLKHGSVVGVADLVGMKVGGKIAGRFLTKGTTKAEKALGIGGGLMTETFTEGAGEAGGQLLASGEIDYKDVFLESAMSLLPGTVANLAIEPALSRFAEGPAAAPATEDDIGSAIREFGLAEDEPSLQTRIDLAEDPEGEVLVSNVVQSRRRETPPDAEVVSLTPTQEVDGRARPTPEVVEQLFRQHGPVAPPRWWERTRDQIVWRDPSDPTNFMTQSEVELYHDHPELLDPNFDPRAAIARGMAAFRGEPVPEPVGPEEAKYNEAVEKQRSNIPLTLEEKKGSLGLRVVEGGKPQRSATGKPPALGMRPREDVPARPADPLAQVPFDPLATENIPAELVPVKVQLHERAVTLGRALFEIKKKLGIPQQMRINFRSHLGSVEAGQTLAHIRTWGKGSSASGRVRRPSHFMIEVAVDLHSTPEELWASMTHELGHMLVYSKFKDMPANVKSSLLAEFRNWRRTQTRAKDSVAAALYRRDNLVAKGYTPGRAFDSEMTIAQLDPSVRRYWLSFDEFMAEQFAKWATTNERPISVAEKWLAGIAKKLRQLYDAFLGSLGTQVELAGDALPNAMFERWLDNMMDSSSGMAYDAFKAASADTARTNANAMRQDGYAPYEVEESVQVTPSRVAMNKLFNGNVPPQVKSAAASADKMNRFMEWMLSLQQVAEINKDVRDLQHYREDVAVMNLEVQENMTLFHETVRQWNNLGHEQGDRLTDLLEDYSAMSYLTPEEVKQGVIRKPTTEEFQALTKKHKVGGDGLRVFGSITKTFDFMLGKYKQLLTSEANKIADPNQRAASLASIDKRFREYGRVPYFPWMRFGDYVVIVRNSAGNVVQREHYESERKQMQAFKELRRMQGSGSVPKDHTVSTFVVPKTAKAFIGMPPGLLDKISEKIGMGAHLSSAQERDLRKTLEQLRFEYAPAHSFKHRFQKKSRTPGYSKNFKRAFATYGFFGSRHLARVKYVDQLREYVRAVHEQSQFMPNGNKRSQIANLMQSHLDEMLDPTADFPALRGIAFYWYLGWAPASAALNLSQMLLTSAPFLSSKFGDLQTFAEMAGASSRYSTYYKKATLEGSTEKEIRMLGELSRRGIISEARAPELAALSEDRNLLLPLSGVRGEITTFLSKTGAFLFAMAEQTNRRVTARAALQLALKNPNNAYVKDRVERNPKYYKELIESGWTETEAAAIVTAKDVVNTTQFEYAREAHPKFMRGKARTLFTFKTFQQNMLFFLWNYPTAAARTMLVMGFMGGLMGLPGADELGDILKILAHRLFGKDFDLEREARKLVLEITGDDMWEVAGKNISPADLLTRGAARYGMGVPAVMDMLGGTVGIDIPFPTLDRSKAFGLGRILPFSAADLAGPTNDPDRALATAMEDSSGAAFGIFFNQWRFLQAIQAKDSIEWKDAEKALPRAAGAVSKAFRYAYEGMEKDRSGAAVVRFDPTDTEHMAEILGVAMGYQPLRVSREWDLIMAKMEVTQYWNLRKQILLRQADFAFKTGDQEAISRMVGAIKKFNSDLPKDAKGKSITSKILRQSLQTKARLRAEREAGIPQSRQDAGLVRGVQQLFPEATGPNPQQESQETISVRPVR